LLLDRIAIVIGAAVIGFILGVFGVLGDVSEEAPERWLDVVAGLIISIVYHVVLEASTGRTLAKFITKTQVLDNSCRPASFGQILGRTLTRFIPFEPFSIFGKSGLMWHDLLSNTITVDLSRPM
jgi:uncharacterized RDD family membrane protein YckC